MTAVVLEHAFETMAAYMMKKRINITLVVIGGAVSTFHLRTRTTTGDVDYFLERSMHADAKVVVKAARKAERQQKRSLSEGWFNNSVQCS